MQPHEQQAEIGSQAHGRAGEEAQQSQVHWIPGEAEDATGDKCGRLFKGLNRSIVLLESLVCQQVQEDAKKKRENADETPREVKELLQREYEVRGDR